MLTIGRVVSRHGDCHYRIALKISSVISSGPARVQSITFKTYFPINELITKSRVPCFLALRPSVWSRDGSCQPRLSGTKTIGHPSVSTLVGLSNFVIQAECGERCEPVPLAHGYSSYPLCRECWDRRGLKSHMPPK